MVPFLHWWRYRDFTKMGRGIESRYRRCTEWWEPHIRCTKEFLSSHLRPSRATAVLGAGRLYDIDLARLLECSEVVHLFDLDITCVPHWRRLAGRHFGRRVVPHIVDLTGCLEEWQGGLAMAHREGNRVNYLQSLVAPEPRWGDGTYDTVISLNLLGQIPLYWRDRVMRCFGTLSAEEQGSLEHSMGALQQAHLRALTARPECNVFLLTDTEYYFYTTSQSEWRVESALWGGAYQMYQGLTRDLRWTGQQSWMWHLVPHVVEAREEGEIHRVEALFAAAS